MAGTVETSSWTRCGSYHAVRNPEVKTFGKDPFELFGQDLNLVREELRVLRNALAPTFVRYVFTQTVHKCEGPVFTKCRWIWPAAARPFAGPSAKGLKWCKNCDISEVVFQAWAGTSRNEGLPDTVVESAD